MKLVLLTLAVALLIAPAASAHTLTYGKAKRAAQQRGDAAASQRTEVNTIFRTGRHVYYAQARWSYEDPTGCKGCEYDEATGEATDGPSRVSCFVEIRVRYRTHRSRRPVATVQSRTCS